MRYLILLLLAFNAQAQVSGVGASVSGGWAGTPPAQLLAQKLGESYLQDTHIGALGGASHLVPVLLPETWQARYIVGIDLFFWDSYADDCTKSLEQMNHLLQRAEGTLVIGTVPVIEVSWWLRILALTSGSTQACRQTINQALQLLCLRPKCILIDIDGLVAKVPEGLMLDGELLKGRSLMPDGLHSNTRFNEIVARVIYEQLRN